jgi:hypothetical protein
VDQADEPIGAGLDVAGQSHRVRGFLGQPPAVEEALLTIECRLLPLGTGIGHWRLTRVEEARLAGRLVFRLISGRGAEHAGELEHLRRLSQKCLFDCCWGDLVESGQSLVDQRAEGYRVRLSDRVQLEFQSVAGPRHGLARKEA